MLSGHDIGVSATTKPALDGRLAVEQIERWLAARPPQPANPEAVFEALRAQMQKIEDRWRTQSVRIAEILDDIGRSETLDDILRHLARLEQHLQAKKDAVSVRADESGSPPRRRAVRTLLRL